MEYTIKKDEKYIILTLKEEKLDAVIAPDVKAELVKFEQDGFKNMILDLSHTKYIDSSGLSAILVGNRLCTNEKGSFVISNCSDHVMKLITISQLQSILNLTKTNQEAIDLVFMNELENDINSSEG